jgi:hypothetical protein
MRIIKKNFCTVQEKIKIGSVEKKKIGKKEKKKLNFNINININININVSVIFTRETLFSSSCSACDLSPLRNTNPKANSVILDHSYKLPVCSVETTGKIIEKISVGHTNIPEFLWFSVHITGSKIFTARMMHPPLHILAHSERSISQDSWRGGRGGGEKERGEIKRMGVHQSKKKEEGKEQGGEMSY